MPLKMLIPLAAALLLSTALSTKADTPLSKEAPMPEKNIQIATLAGGCFWCLESDMKQLPGVLKAVSGYAGGKEEKPSYEQVSSGTTGHREAVKVSFDPAVISYEQVLGHFLRAYDPTDEGGSFGDRGFQYTSAIFYHDEEQKRIAEDMIRELNESGRFAKPVTTPILPFTTFHEAEEYHQDYSRKNPARYKAYRHFSGRDRFIGEYWGENRQAEGSGRYARPDQETLRRELTDLQYHVTQEQGTERPFDNEYWDNHEQGIYVDVASGEPLFSSTDKFDSGTGWPSFTRPLEPENIVEKKDRTLLIPRTEVRSRHGDSHLGHVFNDGPPPTGLRYCINSAALRFIPRERLQAEGYGEYADSFK